MDASALANAESWLSVIATAKLVAAFLVAIGVAIEFGGDWVARPFEKVVSEAREQQLVALHTETVRLSADAEASRAQIAEAQARAAEANQKAEEEQVERLKLQAKYAWRLLSGEQIGRIAEAASAFPHTPYDAGVAHDAEPLHLLDLIVQALELAHWDMRNWGGPGGVMVKSTTGAMVGAFVIGVNVDVAYAPSEEETFGPAAKALAEALTAEGITAAARISDDTRLGQIRIRVGSKPP